MNRKTLTAVVSLLSVIVIAIIVVVATLHRPLVIEGQVMGLDSKVIYLEQLVGGERQVVDSAMLSDIGDFRIKVKGAAEEPSLYELRLGWDRVPLFAQQGDKITLTSIGKFAQNYMIEGSQESELLREFYQPYMRESAKLRKLAAQYATAQNRGEQSSEIAEQYNKLYNEIKRDQLKFIITHKEQLAAIYAILQHLPGDNYLINESSDLIYMSTIAESVAERYPNSSYLKLLESYLSEAKLRQEIINNVVYRDFPEIEMPDMYGKKQSLSALQGGVILLDFWSAELSRSNPNNAELKEIYSDYHERGFEVYQVGVDTNKVLWINTIQEQRLPWISVSDLRGGNSTSLGLYNITSLPSNILIDRDGNVVERNIYGAELRKALDKYIE